MTETLYEEGVVSLVEQKLTKTGKNYWIYIVNNKKFSSFNDLELSSGDNVKMTYKINAGYNNAMGAILLGGEKPLVSYEDVKEPPVSFEDKRRKEITVGQAANLSMQYLTATTGQALTPEEYDQHFKTMSKRFFKLLTELQKELL